MIDDWTPHEPSPLRITALDDGLLFETYWAPFKMENFDRFGTDDDNKYILVKEREALGLARWLESPGQKIELQCSSFGSVQSIAFRLFEFLIQVDVKQDDCWSEMVQFDLDEAESLRRWLIEWLERHK